METQEIKDDALKPVITIGEKAYTLRPKVLEEYAEREQYILSLKPDPVEILDRLPPLPEAPKQPIPPDAGVSMDVQREYQRKLGDYRKAERAHLERVAARKRFEAGLQAEALKPRVVSFDDERAFDNSLHGTAFKLWRALRDNHPEVNSVEAALTLIEQAGTARFKELHSRLDSSSTDASQSVTT